MVKDFQELVLDELRSLRQGQDRIEGLLAVISKRLDAVYEQTADLTEFRTALNEELDDIVENNKSVSEVIGEHEIAIRTLRRRSF